jgi:hypothetical protein
MPLSGASQAERNAHLTTVLCGGGEQESKPTKHQAIAATIGAGLGVIALGALLSAALPNEPVPAYSATAITAGSSTPTSAAQTTTTTVHALDVDDDGEIDLAVVGEEVITLEKPTKVESWLPDFISTIVAALMGGVAAVAVGWFSRSGDGDLKRRVEAIEAALADDNLPVDVERFRRRRARGDG